MKAFGDFSILGFQSNEHSKLKVCIENLLDKGADPCLGDKCQCACSRMGCTPSHLLLKEALTHSNALVEDIPLDDLVLEFLGTVENSKDFGHSPTVRS